MELGCKLGKIPSFYLGLPPRASCKSEAVWDKVEEKFRRRLLMWKRQYISKGRTLTLIRSTLLSLSIYFISLFVIHRKRGSMGKKEQIGTLVKSAVVMGWCLESFKGFLHINLLFAASFQNTQGNQGESDPNNTTVVGKRCGFVQFANRACAEQALAGLNGTQLGAQSIRLSWGRSPSNKQAQPDQAQWNGGYYGYAQGYEAYGYAPPPQDPNMYYGAYPGYGNYQQPQQLAEGVLTTCGHVMPSSNLVEESFYAYKARIPSTLSFCLVG
ncbi:Polyadenylate-binding protein RBP45 [Vitis vinifera]|uniref:Polyadenylate-binding protein RBP45 n=1 Tax=Vitis vinifera TaxID=29760 RepID=A0A438IS51_VITVI|nr:Polyadenylate-binding protein RBP45 [Vitis vinifera]